VRARRARRAGRAQGDELEAARAHLVRRGAKDPVVLACDLADADSIAPMVERAAQAALGPLDILVNNAGATWGAATVDCRSPPGTR
jgi:gluconate 5-dehydrogenase